MKASIIDIRYKMKDILKALERKEEVRIMYYGKEKGIIVPTKQQTIKKAEDHPFFGSLQGLKDVQSADTLMNKLRGGRYRAL
jgi:hypothetical protein